MCSFLFICKYELPPVVKMFMGIDPCEESLITNGDFLVFLTVLLIVMPLSAAKGPVLYSFYDGFFVGNCKSPEKISTSWDTPPGSPCAA